jgi:hypothetical protein
VRDLAAEGGRSLVSANGGGPPNSGDGGRGARRRTSPTGDERHNKSKSGPTGRQPQREQLAAGRDLLLGVGRHRPPESKQQASVRQRSMSVTSAGGAVPVRGEQHETVVLAA